MIRLNGSTQREFTFPADPQTAFHYFSDLQRVAFLLPHITVTHIYAPNALRVHYQSVELGAYTINIFADLYSAAAADEMTIYVQPLKGVETVAGEATLNTATGQGFFSSIARFSSNGSHTHIDYRLKLEAEMPRPRGLRMMPGRVVNRIAASISQERVREIANGFMEAAIQYFPDWSAEEQAVR